MSRFLAIFFRRSVFFRGENAATNQKRRAEMRRRDAAVLFSVKTVCAPVSSLPVPTPVAMSAQTRRE
jgi:hypothetical protein